MKNSVITIFLLMVCFPCCSQSETIKRIFKLIPAEKIYDLTVATRDSMLEGKTYYPAENDSTEVAAFNYGESTYISDYMYISLSFETAQRATGLIEIRNFKMMNGDNMALVSQTGGVWNVAYNQDDLSAYIYKNKKLIPYKNKILPKADETIFMKQGIPDSVKKVILSNSNMTFDLSKEKVNLALTCFYISHNENLRKWLNGDIIYFDWINDHFLIRKMAFQ